VIPSQPLIFQGYITISNPITAIRAFRGQVTMQHEEDLCRPANLWRRLMADWLLEEDQVAVEFNQVADERPVTSDEVVACELGHDQQLLWFAINVTIRSGPR